MNAVEALYLYIVEDYSQAEIAMDLLGDSGQRSQREVSKIVTGNGFNRERAAGYQSGKDRGRYAYLKRSMGEAQIKSQIYGYISSTATTRMTFAEYIQQQGSAQSGPASPSARAPQTERNDAPRQGAAQRTQQSASRSAGPSYVPGGAGASGGKSAGIAKAVLSAVIVLLVIIGGIYVVRTVTGFFGGGSKIDEVKNFVPSSFGYETIDEFLSSICTDAKWEVVEKQPVKIRFTATTVQGSIRITFENIDSGRLTYSCVLDGVQIKFDELYSRFR